VKKKHNQAKSSGLTLIELLLAICLISIFALASFSSWRHFLEKNQLEIATSDLLQFLKSARQNAIEKGERITVCPSSDHQYCDKNWSAKSLIICDKTQVIAFQDFPEIIQLNWKSSLGHNDQLVFLSTGLTHGQQGHFTVSHKKNNQSSEVVVLMGGAIYVRAIKSSISESKYSKSGL